MHRYETSTPRVALGITAVAMTAITVAVFVGMPARVESDGHEPHLLAVSKVTTPVSTAFVTGVPSVDVVAVREQELAATPCPPSKPKRKAERQLG